LTARGSVEGGKKKRQTPDRTTHAYRSRRHLSGDPAPLRTLHLWCAAQSKASNRIYFQYHHSPSFVVRVSCFTFSFPFRFSRHLFTRLHSFFSSVCVFYISASDCYSSSLSTDPNFPSPSSVSNTSDTSMLSLIPFTLTGREVPNTKYCEFAGNRDRTG
jgi:hypothetical protein